MKFYPVCSDGDKLIHRTSLNVMRVEDIPNCLCGVECNSEIVVIAPNDSKICLACYVLAEMQE